jgi:hypothetical protein
MENISIAISGNRIADNYKDSKYYASHNHNNLNEISVNNIDDDIIENFDGHFHSNDNSLPQNNHPGTNNNASISQRSSQKRDKKKKKLRRKRIKFNEKRKRLNYYDKLFRYSNDTENNKVLSQTNFASTYAQKLDKDEERDDNGFSVSSFERQNEVRNKKRKVKKIRRLGFIQKRQSDDS